MSISSLQSHLYSTESRKWTTSMDNYPGNAFGKNIKIRFHSKSDSKLNFSKVLSLDKANHHSPFSPVQCLSGSVHQPNHKCKPITNQIQSGNSSLMSTILKTIDAFVRFTRPHTIVGTIIGITSVSLLPVESFSDLKLSFFIGLIKMIVPAVLMNIYIVGLNEIYDVEIDKINKPTLPLASGEFTMGVGIALVTASFILSFITGFQSPPLLLALLISCILGTIYSIDLPLLRWKQYPLLAASCILFVRALLLQLAFFAHTQKYILGKPLMINKSSMFGTSFMCCFVAVIALFKDIPDIEGDKNFGIQSFSVQLGAEKVFWLCIKILLTAYTIAMTLGATAPNLYLKFITVIGHGVLALLLLYRAKSVDVKSSASMYSFYMFIWKLFYAEYFLIPFVR